MVLVTGITGKTGTLFLQRIISEKNSAYQFRAIVRETSKTELLDQNPLKFEKAYGDLTDIGFVDSTMNNISIVLHIAGIYTSLNIVKAALRHNVRWIILVHTTGIYSKYKSASYEYLSIEKEIDRMIAGSGVKLTILRPTMIYGSIADRNIIVFVKMIDKLKLFPVVNHGRYLLQPVYEKDLGDAYYQVLTHEDKTANKNYILSGKEPIMLIDILKTIGKKLDKSTVFISIPFTLAYIGGWLLYVFSFKKIDYREKIQRLVEDRNFDHGDASCDFGYNPISFEDGIQNEIFDYMNR